MSQVLLRFDNLGTRNDGTAPVSGGTPVASLGSTTPNRNRQGINIHNHSASYGIRVYLSQSPSAPTISANAYDIRIPPLENVTLSCNGGIRVWLISEDAGNACTFSALELL